MIESTTPKEASEKSPKPREKSSKKTQKKSGEKSDYTVKNESRIIREFLRQLEMHEADAIIACIKIAEGKVTLAEVKDEKMNAINIYLDSNMTVEKADSQAMLSHRLSRSFTLAERVRNFCDSKQLLPLSNLLAVIATDAKMVENAVKKLSETPINPFADQPSLFDEKESDGSGMNSQNR